MQIAVIAQSIASVFNAKIKKRHQGLKNQNAREPQSKESDVSRYLFHCASHGEYEQAKPLIERLRAQNSQNVVIASFFSTSGYDVAVAEQYVDEIYYLPIDTRSRMRRFLNAVDPTFVFIIKYEIWCNFIKELKIRKIPIYLISARFHQSQRFFKWYGGVFRQAIQSIDKIFVQDSNSQKLLRTIDVDSIISGDTRADRQLVNNHNIHPVMKYLLKWKQEKPLLILGSVWEDGWSIFSPVIHEIIKDYKVLIAPHEIREKFIAQMESDIIGEVARWSTLALEETSDAAVIILDTIGDLQYAYGAGDVAYVGGGFKQGLHNVLEPASCGLPVIFGPNIQDYAEAKDLMSVGAAWSFKSSKQLRDLVVRLQDNDNRRIAASKAKTYVNESRGATDIIINHFIENHQAHEGS